MIPDEPADAIHVDVVPLVALVDRLVEESLFLDDILHGVQHLRSRRSEISGPAAWVGYSLFLIRSGPRSM